jgi:uncharacterized protein YndB with AHSA1/START domain
MTETKFVYVTFIRTTPERLWQALATAEFTKQYWFGTHQDTDWKPGSPWRLVFADGRVADAGEIVAADPPKRLVIKWRDEWKKWRNEWRPELRSEGFSYCTFGLEPANGAVKLTITHTIDRADSKLIEAVAGGWPKILSNLKSLLETGKIALETVSACG